MPLLIKPVKPDLLTTGADRPRELPSNLQAEQNF